MQGLIGEFRPEPSYKRNASLNEAGGVDPGMPIVDPAESNSM